MTVPDHYFQVSNTGAWSIFRNSSGSSSASITTLASGTTLVKLGQRLELRQAATDTGRDRTITAVLETLQSEARPSWLLVYDNAVNPLDLQKYLPASRRGGHIIITSRQLNWPSYIAADNIEVSPFTEEEAISFLRRRVPGLSAQDRHEQLTREEDAHRVSEAGRLAAELGYLPIAMDHAAAYLAETSQSVDEYLIRFAENAHQLLSEQPGDSDLPAPVSGTWAMSTTLLTPDAEHLFNLCAFFSPEPIAAELFLQDTAGIDDPPGLGEFLSSPHRFRAAAWQLHRLSLAKVDAARDLIQVHRVVQAVTQGRIRQYRVDMFHAYHRQLGRFREALETDERTFKDRRRILGPDDPITLHDPERTVVLRALAGSGLPDIAVSPGYGAR